jgi:hypothetical protein
MCRSSPRPGEPTRVSPATSSASLSLLIETKTKVLWS